MLDLMANDQKKKKRLTERHLKQQYKSSTFLLQPYISTTEICRPVAKYHDKGLLRPERNGYLPPFLVL